MTAYSDDDSYWHLGSVVCSSEFGGLCGDVLVFPEGSLCGGPGCRVGSVQDLSSSQCRELDTHRYNQSLRYERHFQWALSEIGEYYSRCDLREFMDNTILNCR